MRRVPHTRFQFRFILVLLTLHTACAADDTGIVNGTIDLRTWDPLADGPVELSGTWDFSWTASGDVDAGEIGVPGFWNNGGTRWEGRPGIGLGTYRLRVLLPDASPPVAIRTGSIHTAYELRVNGVRATGSGTVGNDRESSRPAVAFDVAAIDTTESDIEIEIEVSNFHYARGGIPGPLFIGAEVDLRRRVQNARLRDAFLGSAIAAMALYFLILHLLQRRDGSALWFALFCLALVVRTLVTGEIIAAEIIPTLSWYSLIRLEYASFYLAVPLFLTYLHALFPAETHRRVLQVSQFTGGAFVLLVIATPTTLYTRSVYLYQAITVLAGLYALYVLSRATVAGRVGARTLVAGFLFLFVVVIHDILHANQVVMTESMFPVGSLIFLFSQAALVARRNAHAFELVETQASELTEKNRAFQEEIGERQKLEGRLLMTHQQLEEARIGMILGLAKLAECRDEDTGAHLERIREYCRVLATELATYERYRGYITPEYIEDLYQSSILHDIGKVGIPDSILLKPGSLTKDEFELMKTHTTLGGDAIQRVEAGIRVQSFLTLAKQIAYCHHERWDGTGYPGGLKGNDIPLSARIVALADVYDALTSGRPYKSAFSHETAQATIVAGRGGHFDPEVVDAFLSVESTFAAVRRRLQDAETVSASQRPAVPVQRSERPRAPGPISVVRESPPTPED